MQVLYLLFPTLLLILWANAALPGAIYPDLDNCVNIEMSGSRLQSPGSSCNCVGRPIPADLFTTYPDLQTISVSNCNFSGAIPPNIQNLTSLYGLALGGNNFSGIILDYLVNMDITTTLSVSLDNNLFTGTIPAALQSFPFGILSLSNNNFSGQIPNFTNLSPTSIFNLANNSFNGSALNVLTMAKLAGAGNSFSISGNHLTSPVPSQLPAYVTPTTLSDLTCITFINGDSVPTWCTLPLCRCAPQCQNNIWEVGEGCDGICCQNCTSGALRPSSFTCRTSTGVCDPAEHCTNGNSSCPPDTLYPSTHLCRNQSDTCDTAAYCSGNTSQCPFNVPANSSVVCRQNTTICEVPIYCSGSSISCPPISFYANSSVLCRPPLGVCDVEDFCSGNSSNCTDNFHSNSTFCRAAQADCDEPAMCSGTNASCPPNPLKPSEIICRFPNGTCDIAEYCTGNNASCPADTFFNSSVVCRNAIDSCDTTAYCTGNSTTCPLAYLDSSYVCRAANGSCDIAENCTGYNASCPADTFFNSSVACHNATDVCDAMAYCTGKDATCPQAYLGSSFVCRPANGSCDIEEMCTGYYATCPQDLFLDSSHLCNSTCHIYCSGSSPECTFNVTDSQCAVKPSCGDSNCDKDVGENCVNCVPDCPAPCGLCGDGLCDVSETCANCYEDCHAQCPNVTCIPTCVNGTCNSGICNCYPPYIGPSCDQLSQPITITTNDTSPIVDLGFDSSKFSINILSIEEQTPDSTVVYSHSMVNYTYNVTTQNATDYQFWNYSAILSNKAIVNIYFFIFINTTNFTFAGETNLMIENTIKLAYFVSSWPFQNTRNGLVVWLQTGSTNQVTSECGGGQQVDTRIGGGDNLLWMAITVDGQTLYAQMQDYAMVDGVKRAVQFGTQNTQISIRSPFFWYNLTLDPNFALLVHTSTSPSLIPSSCKKSTKWEYYLAIPIGVLLILVGVLIFFHSRIKQWWKTRSHQTVQLEMD